MRGSWFRPIASARAVGGLLALAGPGVAARTAAEPPPVLFAHQTDIGSPKRPGTMAYDAAGGTYAIGGGGANMWLPDSTKLAYVRYQPAQ